MPCLLPSPTNEAAPYFRRVVPGIAMSSCERRRGGAPADRRGWGRGGPSGDAAVVTPLPAALVVLARQLPLVHLVGVRRFLGQGRIVLVGVADLLLEALLAGEVVGPRNAPGVVRHVPLLPVAWLSRASRTGRRACAELVPEPAQPAAASRR